MQSRNITVLILHLLLGFLLVTSLSYKPIICVHGLLGAAWNNCQAQLAVVRQHHPGTVSYSFNKFENFDSLINPLWKQTEALAEFIMKVKTENNITDGGYHLMCTSQGTLLCRGALSLLPNHGVDKFLSVAGPLLGVYGVPTDVLHRLLGNFTTQNLYLLLYTSLGQNTLSLSGMWRDPFRYEDYKNRNLFLPLINNEIEHIRSKQFKENFLKIRKLILFGGPGEDVIRPWQSNFFGFWGDRMQRNLTMIEQEIFQRDTFGLKTLHESNRIIFHERPGLTHLDWIFNVEVIEKNIVDYLD